MRNLPLILLLACVLAGCSASKKPAPITAVGNAIARADAHTDSAAARVEEAKPHSNNIGKALLDVAGKELAAAGVDHIEAASQLEQAAKDHNFERARADKAEGFWGYRWGKRIQAWLTLIIVTWATLGVVSIVTGVMAGPWINGALATVCKEIIRWLPLAAPFSWVRDMIRSRKNWIGL